MILGLKEKVAVITGASVGIGLAVAEGLAAEGVHIVMVARQENRLKKEPRRIARQYRVEALAVACDVPTAAGCNALVAAAQQDGHADTANNRFWRETEVALRTVSVCLEPSSRSRQWARFGSLPEP